MYMCEVATSLDCENGTEELAEQPIEGVEALLCELINLEGFYTIQLDTNRRLSPRETQIANAFGGLRDAAHHLGSRDAGAGSDACARGRRASIGRTGRVSDARAKTHCHQVEQINKESEKHLEADDIGVGIEYAHSAAHLIQKQKDVSHDTRALGIEKLCNGGIKHSCGEIRQALHAQACQFEAAGAYVVAQTTTYAHRLEAA